MAHPVQERLHAPAAPTPAPPATVPPVPPARPRRADIAGGLIGGYVVLGVAIRVCVAVRILIDGRQCEFVPLAGLGELYLYFCVHPIGTLISSKSVVSSVSMAFSAIAARA